MAASRDGRWGRARRARGASGAARARGLLEKHRAVAGHVPRSREAARNPPESEISLNLLRTTWLVGGMQASGYGFSLYTVGAVGGLWVQFVSVCATHKKHNIYRT